MTREEERKEAAATYILEMYGETDEDSDVAEGFSEGAKWADKTMIEKACKWLLRQEEMIGISFENDFIERFKKAMES